MATFSERVGAKSISLTIQIDDISDELRNALWSLQYDFVWSTAYSRDSGRVRQLARLIWFNVYERPVDELAVLSEVMIVEKIRDRYFRSAWHEVYTIIEIIVKEYSRNNFDLALNQVLERYLSGYRLVDKKFIPITDQSEIKAIQQAAAQTKYFGASEHIRKAVEILSNKDAPDYRNCIKESISAVESVAKELTGEPKATLGAALGKLDLNLHSALKEGFQKLYGYTSDADGIRHSLLKKDSVNADDARYFLISCSAFVNYLIAKSA